MTIAECANQRGHQKLGQGIAPGQQSEGAAIGGELCQQKGEQGKDDALAQAIVQKSQKGAQEDRDPKALHGIWLLGDTHTPIGP